MSDSLWPHGLQHYRLPCPSLFPRVCSNSHPLSLSRIYIHPTISSSVIHPLLSCPQSFPVSGSFPMSWLFTSGVQNIGASALASVLSVTIQGWFPLVLTSLISLLSKGRSRVFSNTTIQKHQFVNSQPTFLSSFHMHTWLLEKNMALTIWTFVGKRIFLLFNMPSSFVIAFLPRSRCLLIFWLKSLSAVILEPNNINPATVSTFSTSICKLNKWKYRQICSRGRNMIKTHKTKKWGGNR